MKMKLRTKCGPVIGVIAVLFAAGVSFGQETSGGRNEAERKDQPAAPAPPKASEPAAVAAARERAKLLHDVYSTTLDVMHRHYFRPERAVLPARAMEDVFEDMAMLSKDKVRWIAVNTPPMSIQH